MKEFGGYLPFELSKGEEFYGERKGYNISRWNSARSAIVVALKSLHATTAYIPYYNCEAVKCAIEYNGITIKQFFLDEHLCPIIPNYGGEPVLIVNYFGCFSKDKIENIINKYEKIIIDNTQAFFCNPIIKENVYNVYSCRKFVGVCDGGYLISKSCVLDNMYPADISWHRSLHLLRCIEEGTNAAYKESIEAEDDIGYEIKTMSLLTKKILLSVDYNMIFEKRTNNFSILHELLGDNNEISDLIQVPALMIYPFVITRDIRSKLIEKKIYVPQWWKYLLRCVPENTFENKLCNYLFPLPIDQRYNVDEVIELAKIVKEII